MENKISVLMTVYNCDLFIEESVKSILNQTHKNFELIVVDDFSNDKSYEKLKKFDDNRIKIFKLDRRHGRTKALNYGLSRCGSDIISIQDADDISEKGRLAESIKKLQSDNKLGMVCTNYDFINSKNEVLKRKGRIINKKNIFSKLLYLNLIAHSSVTFKRNKAGIKNFFYDEEYFYAQDYNLILRYFRDSKIEFIDEKLVRIRDYDGNMSNTQWYAKIRIIETLKLLEFSKKNFKLNFFDKIKIKYFKYKYRLKLLWINMGE